MPTQLCGRQFDKTDEGTNRQSISQKRIEASQIELG